MFENQLNVLSISLECTYNSSTNDRVQKIEYGFKCVTGALEFIYFMVLNIKKAMDIEIIFKD